MQKRDRHLQDWIQTTPTIQRWCNKVAYRSKTTAEAFNKLVQAVLEGNPDKKKIAERFQQQYLLDDKAEQPTATESGN